MVPPSPVHAPTWQVRITAIDGTVVGGGVLVPGNQILTCAHVVSMALGRQRGVLPSGRDDTVNVEMRHIRYESLRARVIDETWDAERDTTLLALEGQPDCVPARLSPRSWEIHASREEYLVRVQGYPMSNAEGISVTARAIAPGGNRPQRFQLDIGLLEPVRFEPGFSGCGVMDVRDGSVIGILTSARLGGSRDTRLFDRDGSIGLMEPIEMVKALRAHTVDVELDAVWRVLSAVRFEATWAAYGAATRRRATERVDFGSAWEAFSYLRDLTPREDGLPREIVYVEEIARDEVISPHVLRAYSDSRHRAEVPVGPLERLRETEGGTRPSGAAALTILADPVPSDPGAPQSYVLSHWLSDGERTDKGNPFRISEDGLGDAVLWLIEEGAKQLHARACASDMRLEFILPLALVTAPIAQWRLRAPITGVGERVGASYEIVLHAHERLNDPGWERVQRNMAYRWRELRSRGKGRLYRVPPEVAVDVGVLHDQLSEPEIVLCVLDTAVHRDRGRLQLAAALQAGLPGIVWIQGNEVSQDIDRAISKISESGGDTICFRDVDSLPRRLREWRTRSGPDEAGFDPYDIIVVLDNMDRIQDLNSAGILKSPKKSDVYD